MGVGKYNSTEPTITIPMKEFQRLNDSDRFLEALQAAGVDNWDGYDIAREAMAEED